MVQDDSRVPCHRETTRIEGQVPTRIAVVAEVASVAGAINGQKLFKMPKLRNLPEIGLIQCNI